MLVCSEHAQFGLESTMLDARVKAFITMVGQRKAKNGGGKIGTIANSCGFKSLDELRDFLNAHPFDKQAVVSAGIDLDAVAYVGHRNIKEAAGRDSSIPQAAEPEPFAHGIVERDVQTVERMLALGAPFRTAAGRAGLKEAHLRQACLESPELTRRLLIAESTWSEQFFTELKNAMMVAAGDGNLKPFLDAAAARFPEAYSQVASQQAGEASKARRLSSVDQGEVDSGAKASKAFLIVKPEPPKEPSNGV